MANGSAVEKSALNEKLIEHYDHLFHDESGSCKAVRRKRLQQLRILEEGTSCPREASENLVDRLLEKVPDKAGQVLDVACGAGGTTRRLAERFGAANVTAINISSYQLEKTSKLRLA